MHLTPHEAWALILAALAGALTLGWLWGRWQVRGRYERVDGLMDQAYDEGVASWRVPLEPYREQVVPDTTGDIPIISSELLPPEWPSPRALDPPADWLDAPAGDLADEQWAAELHQMNQDLPGPSAELDPRSRAGELHWPSIVASMDPLTRLKLEGGSLRQRQQVRLAAWEDACRKSWDVQVAA